MPIVHHSMRFPQLDGLRGAAILLVLFWDFSALCKSAPRTVFSYVIALNRLNWSGVDLFFVLSGFLIGGILFDSREAPLYFSPFYMRRACRIFPLYYLSLLIFALCALAFLNEAMARNEGMLWVFSNQGIGGQGLTRANPIPQWTYYCYLQNWYMAHYNTWGPGWLGITWSLAVEEQFYLILPIMIYLMRPRQIAFTCIVGIFVAPLLRMWYEGLGGYCLLQCRADSLLTGVLIAWFLRQNRVMNLLNKNSVILKMMSLIAACAYLVLLKSPAIFGYYDHTLLAAVYGILLTLAVCLPTCLISKLLCCAVLRWTGRISYGVYISHTVFIGLAHATVFGAAPRIQTLSEAVVTITAIILAMFFSYLSFVYFESRFIAFGQRFAYRENQEILTPPPNVNLTIKSST